MRPAFDTGLARMKDDEHEVSSRFSEPGAQPLQSGSEREIRSRVEANGDELARRTAVSMCQAAWRPMQVWWGTDLVILCCNDGSAAIHPHELGKPAREVWRDRWDELAPAVEVARGGATAIAGALSFTPIPGGILVCLESDAIEKKLRELIHASQPPRSLPRPARGTRLLLVEDNDDDARALKVALEGLGFVVALAHDAPVALSLARTFEPDFALVDLGLPVMDGYEMARRLRAHRPLTVLAVTARALDVDRQRSAEEGFAAHIVKPIELDRLVQLLAELAPDQRA